LIQSAPSMASAACCYHIDATSYNETVEKVDFGNFLKIWTGIRGDLRRLFNIMEYAKTRKIGKGTFSTVSTAAKSCAPVLLCKIRCSASGTFLLRKNVI